jgi:hypothetical protein
VSEFLLPIYSYVAIPILIHLAGPN